MASAHLVPITGLYAGVMTIVFAALSLRVGLTRASTGVMYGEGPPGGDRKGKEHLTHISRAQGNLAEYLGIFVVLLAVLELNGASGGTLHFLGALFTVARLSHATQVSMPSLPSVMRSGGFLTTIGLLVLMGFLATAALRQT